MLSSPTSDGEGHTTVIPSLSSSFGFPGQGEFHFNVLNEQLKEV